MGLVPELLDIRNVAAVMDKNYDHCCDYCLVATVSNWLHCYKCHESFSERRLFDMHFHHKTGGCRYPGNIERFYELKFWPDVSVWDQKPDPKAPKEEKT